MKAGADFLRAVEMVEVGPRDGLQNESALLSTSDKLQLIERAIDAGLRRIEVASFVNPRRVPQMVDATEVVAGLPDREDVTFIGVVLNERGAERALATKLDQLGAVCVATDSFAMANQGQTSAESLDVALRVMEMARAAGRSGQITIGASFGCPFEGDVPIGRIVAMARRAADGNPVEIALADTIGVAVPSQVTALVTQVRDAIAPIPVRVHFHNTRNTGIANVWAAIGAGAGIIDASVGGLGGCPFAPGAAGNVATEDVVYMLERSGIPTGLDLRRLISVSHWLGDLVGRKLPSMVAASGPFVPTAVQTGRT